MSGLAAAAAVLAALAPLGAGLRKAYKSTAGEMPHASLQIAGVPIYNYDLRHLQRTHRGRFEWNLIMQRETDINSFCSRATCKKRGHSDGVPFVSVDIKESDLWDFFTKHTNEVSFGEPFLADYVPDDLVLPGIAEEKEQVTNDLWHLNRVGRYRSTLSGKGTHIYVMDTGVRSTHQDFGGRAIPTLDTLAGNGDPVECNGEVSCATDYHGHGTHVAGTAAGRAYGVAPDATIHIMKVCCGPGTNVLGGMDWIVANAALPAIMTVSLAATGRSEASRMAVDRVVNAGVTVTVGAANDNVDTCTMTYGFIASAISVGATDSNDRRAVFSNWGSCNDIYAPGVGIFSAWKDSDDATRTISGTSMATPMVAGAAALLLEQDPTRSPGKVMEKLQERAIRGVITDLQPGDPDLLLFVQ